MARGSRSPRRGGDRDRGDRGGGRGGRSRSRRGDRRDSGRGGDRGGYNRDRYGSDRRDRGDRGDRRERGAPEAPPEEPPAPVKTGAQKAKEQIEKEREKARLKKLEREKAQNERQQAKIENKERKREEIQNQLAEDMENQAGAAPAGAPSDAATDEKAEAIKSAPEKPIPPPAEPAQPRKHRHSATPPPTASEAELKQLFGFLDRSNKGVVSQRDVLFALKKHPQVRRLFHLPVNEAEQGASLQSRLANIQESFESGSGLGELKDIYAMLREGSSGTDQTFDWEAFSKCCTTGKLRSSAHAAAALLPRNHSTGEAFKPTKEWQVVPEGAACPGGLEFKMDIATGRTLGRLPPKK